MFTRDYSSLLTILTNISKLIPLDVLDSFSYAGEYVSYILVRACFLTVGKAPNLVFLVPVTLINFTLSQHH